MATAQDMLQNMARNYARAWSSGDPAEVARYFTETGQVIINRGEPIVGRAAITRMAATYFSYFPDLDLSCDTMRKAGGHALFVWTLEGTYAETGNRVVTRGWAEWELTEDLLISSSQDWFDTKEYERQISGG